MAFSLTLDESKIYPPLPTLQEVKQEACKRINYVISAEILNGFNYDVNGTTYHFSFGTEDQANFVQESIRASTANAQGLGDSYTATWRGHLPDGSAVSLTFTLTEFMTLLMYSGTWKGNILAKGWEYKNAIQACTTKLAVEEYLDSINIDAMEKTARERLKQLEGGDAA